MGHAAKAWLLMVAFMYMHSAISAWQAEADITSIDASKLCNFRRCQHCVSVQLYTWICKHAEFFAKTSIDAMYTSQQYLACRPARHGAVRDRNSCGTGLHQNAYCMCTTYSSFTCMHVCHLEAGTCLAGCGRASNFLMLSDTNLKPQLTLF